MTPKKTGIRVLIVDDHAVRHGGTHGPPTHPLLRKAPR